MGMKERVLERATRPWDAASSINGAGFIYLYISECALDILMGNSLQLGVPKDPAIDFAFGRSKDVGQCCVPPPP